MFELSHAQQTHSMGSSCSTMSTVVMSSKEFLDSDDSTVDLELPLHRALADFSMQSIVADSHDKNEGRLRALVCSSVDSIRVYDEQGMLPLHVACREGAPLSIIRDLVRAWPDSVRMKTLNKKSMLPLHLVCRYFAGDAVDRYDILEYLLGRYRDAVKVESGSGELALHLCCRNYFCTLPILDLIAEAYPRALQIGNRKDQLAVHIACQRMYMERLSPRSTKAGMKQTDDDANNSCSSYRVIQYLLAEYPASVAMRDCKGDLPLHIAVRGYQRPQTINLLLTSAPNAVFSVNKSGKTAMALALTSKIQCAKTLDLLQQAEKLFQGGKSKKVKQDKQRQRVPVVGKCC